MKWVYYLWVVPISWIARILLVPAVFLWACVEPDKKIRKELWKNFKK